MSDTSRKNNLELMAMLAKLVGRTIKQLIKLGAPREYIRDTGEIFALITSVIAESLIPDLKSEEVEQSLEKLKLGLEKVYNSDGSVKIAVLNNNPLTIPTKYAAYSDKEWFAESFSLYNMGREDLLDLKFIKLIKEIQE